MIPIDQILRRLAGNMAQATLAGLNALPPHIQTRIHDQLYEAAVRGAETVDVTQIIRAAHQRHQDELFRITPEQRAELDQQADETIAALDRECQRRGIDLTQKPNPARYALLLEMQTDSGHRAARAAIDPDDELDDEFDDEEPDDDVDEDPAPRRRRVRLRRARAATDKTGTLPAGGAETTAAQPVSPADAVSASVLGGKCFGDL